MNAHRHTSGHEHEFEPERGLPEALPAGETLLWQGSPDWRALARSVFHLRKLVVYFAALMAVRFALLLSAGASGGEMLVSLLWMAGLAATAIGLLTLVAWLSARATVYTITDRRVVMRIGIVLTLTFNLPFKRIAAAGLRLAQDGSGDLPLTLNGADRIAWLHLWPHARPWRLARPEPMLRCVPQAVEVALLLAQAWSKCTGLAAETQSFGADAASSALPTLPALPSSAASAASPARPAPRSHSGPADAQPALAGR